MDYPMTVFHDGNCPVCRFDIENLRARNRDGRLRFVDIADAGFEPFRYGLTQRDFAAEIRAQCADGRMIAGVEVFYLAYRAVGLGWIVAPVGRGVLRRAAEAAYRAFARKRGWIGRRFGGVFDYLAARQAARRAVRCKDGVCSVDGKQAQK